MSKDTMTNYEDMDALDLAALVRRRLASPRELLEEAWSRVKRLNGDLNAIVWPEIGMARAIADAPLPAGPFQGVPFVIKDIIATVAGMRATAGSRAMKDNVAQQDTELVRRVKSAGMVIFGRTTTPELAMNPTTEAKVYGPPTRNPWNRHYSSGGSSGGAAAAVAAGIVPIAHGSDGGGSIRAPASVCGLFGLKPTRGRNPLGPLIGESWGGVAVEHAISRSVRDSAALLDWTQGMDPGAPYSAPPVEGSYLAATMRDPPRLRIGLVEGGPAGTEPHSDCVEAVTATARLCETLGHVVAPVSLAQFDFEKLFRMQLILLSAGAASFVRSAAQVLGRTPTEHDAEPATLDAARYSSAMTPADYLAAIMQMHSVGRDLAALMADYDALLTPTLLRPPVKLGEFDTAGSFVGLREKVSRYLGYLPLANYAGLPGMSVPLHINAAGLPIGSHFIGRWGGEMTLFALAAELERAKPWFAVRPPFLEGSPSCRD